MEIDEGGVSKLQSVLAENAALAEELAASFDAASASVQNLVATLAAELPALFGGEGNGNVTESLGGDSGLKLDLDLSAADKSLEKFLKKASQPVRLSADASSVVSAGQSAYDSIKNIFSTPITVKAEADTSAVSSGTSGGGGSTTPAKMSSGGRFSSPTAVEVAEDGGTEYIIPVRREGRAVPLLRQLLSELSPGARESVVGAAVLPVSGLPSGGENGGAPLVSPAGLPALSGFSALAPAVPVTQNTRNVSAPVTINVRAAGSDPERIGSSVYDAAERYLQRALEA